MFFKPVFFHIEALFTLAFAFDSVDELEEDPEYDDDDEKVEWVSSDSFSSSLMRESVSFKNPIMLLVFFYTEKLYLTATFII